jgi:superfamily I DNA/RNA helicase
MLQDLQHEGMGGIRKCKKSLQAFNAAWARLQTDDPGWPHEETDRTFQNGLLSWLRFHRCMLIGELVPEAVRYLRDNPESQDRHAFDHVLVDEYQDLNRAEQIILDLLTGDGDLTIVGDEDQSIYSFKFAHPEGIAEFPTTHPGTHDQDLLECRRCPQIIVDMANSLIAHNAIRSPRTLTCHKGCPEGEVAVVQWRDMKQEAVGIALTIHERVKRGDVAPGRVLILAPRRQIGYAVRDALNEFGTPAHSFFNEEVFDGRPQDLGASRSQQAFTLLNLLASPEDVVSLRCWCGFGTNSLQSPAWTRLRSHCLSNNVEPHEALGQLVAGKIRIPHTTPLASRYADLQTRLIELADVCGQELIDALFPESEAWAEPFRQAQAEDEDGDPIDPKSLLADLRTRAIQPELPTDVEYVRVISLHKSKGLTADMVVVLGCTRGMIPAIIPDHLSPVEQQRFIEEQRRLFFVALTRSRGVLILSNFANMPRDVAHRMRVPVRGGTPTDAQTFASAFLGELGHSRPETLKGRAFLDSMGIDIGG